MSEIVPRWEWRTFAYMLPKSDAVFEGLTPSALADSEEIYFLSGAAPNVKIRDDLVDIKLLREVDPEGLERWEPVLKEPFPLSAKDLATVLDALGIPARARAGDRGIGRGEFQAIVDAAPAVRTVPVHKRRVRYTIGGCMAERSEVEVQGRRALTVAVESTDRPAIRAAIESLGLGDFLNTNYAAGLKWLLDDVPDRFAVIDVGTNSVKFQIGEFDADGRSQSVVDRAEVTRLGEGLERDGNIQPEALERTVAAVAGMADEARRNRVLAIAAVATEALRRAANREAARDAIRQRTGVTVRVVAGDEEGRLAYLAVKAGLGLVEGPVVIFDSGGGSSQFTFGEGSRVDEQFSLPVGAVRFTEQFGLDRAVSRETVDAALTAIAADLARIDGRPSPSLLVGMGGAITNITAVKHELATYDPDVVQGATLELSEIDRQIELYRARDAEDRRSIVGLQPKRAEVILTGACIVRTVMDKLGKDRLTVSDRGLRHGVLVEEFGGRAGT